MAPTLKIALIQMQSKPLALEDNFTRAAAHIRAVASAGCDIAILPEYHLTSWVPDDPRFAASCAASAAYLGRYQNLARELNVSIVPGTICEVQPSSSLTEPGTEIRNMTYFVEASTGEILGTYQKKNLWHPERPHLTASGPFQPHRSFPVPQYPSPIPPASSTTNSTAAAAATNPLRAGLLICWDLAFPEAFRALVADGAHLILIPSWWHMTDMTGEAAVASSGLSERVFLESVPVARACESSVAVVFCNAGGMSQVAMPLVGARGRTEPVAIGGLGPGGAGEEGVGVGEDVVSVVEVDLDLLRVAEESYKVRADMGREGWHYAHTLAWPGGRSS